MKGTTLLALLKNSVTYQDIIEHLARTRPSTLHEILEEIVDKRHPANPPQMSYNARRVYDLAQSGSKVEAIKYFRDETGCSLSNAKNAVEDIMAGIYNNWYDQPGMEDFMKQIHDYHLYKCGQ